MRKVVLSNHGEALLTWTEDSDQFRLSDLYIKVSDRRKGKGNRLLRKSEIEARKLGAKSLKLEVLSSSWTKEWYERKGYVPQLNSCGSNCITMIKNL